MNHSEKYGKILVTQRDINDKDGRIYLTKGKQITLNYQTVKQFEKIGILDEIFRSTQELDEKKEIQQHISDQKNKYEKIDENLLHEAIKPIQNIIFQENIFAICPHLRILTRHANWYYTHGINVAIIATLIANQLGYVQDVIEEIIIGAILHDIGVIFIDKEILNKESSLLTPEEIQVKEKHCYLGAMSVQGIKLPERSMNIINQHHERLDGSGYPNQLRDYQISEEAKIVMIADVVDLNTSSNGLKELMSIEKVVNAICKNSFKYSLVYATILKQICGAF